MNGIVERWNRTLQYMVISMMLESSLHVSLWGEAFKITIYLLKRVITKTTIKIPYELWIGRKPSLKHLHNSGCLVQARPYVPNKIKLYSRPISCYFVVYLKDSWGFKFYDRSTRGIFETENAYFYEDIEFNGRNKVRNTNFKEEHSDIVKIFEGITKSL